MKLKFSIVRIVSLVFCLTAVINVAAQIPAGYYYSAQNKTKSSLKTALKTISTPLQELEYGSGAGFTWQGFSVTDRRTDSTVIDMYSSVVRKQSGYESVDGMHIEHSLPKSWWGAHENMAYKDLFHLYPADATTNMTKSNWPLGIVTGTPTLDNGVSKIGKNGFGNVYADNCFEPADEFKGDFARSYMYISTIYEDFATLWQSPMMNNNTYPVWKSWAKELLLQWHRQDPVSTKERTRNEAIYAIQGNRNPYIDYPELAEYIWGADTLKIFPFPTETNPFLISPRKGTKIDFGNIMTNDQRNSTLHIEGKNLTTNITIALKNASSAFLLSKNTLTASEVINGLDVQLTYSPSTNGVSKDTLIISGGGLTESITIPVKGNASPDFVLTEPTNINQQGGTLQWISDPAATDYLLRVYQPAKAAGDLIFSTYVEGSSWNKAIEIYNGTGKTIDLSAYKLRKQSNGDGAFGIELPLSGTLGNNSTYTIVHKSATNTTLLAKANLLTDTLLQINGNDAISLNRNGITIDMVGEANAGASVIWGLDRTLQRKSTVTHPQSVFEWSEWNSLPIDSVAFIGTHQMQFSADDTNTILSTQTGKVTAYQINSLVPGTKYTYSVDAIRNNSTLTASNTMQLHTKEMDAPVIQSADYISSDSFRANWEESLFADGYLLDVFSLSGLGSVVESEGFDAVGSGGTPLPTGWSSSAISTYTTTTSSGTTPPAIQLNDNGDWLMTKTFPSAVTKLSFMYRFPSSGTGSVLLLEGLQNGVWKSIANYNYVNTSKNYPAYIFDASQNYKQFRFSYNKVSGNMAIDDVQATYGAYDSVYIQKNTPVTTANYVVNGLQPATSYYYRVKSKRGNSQSAFSETMMLSTNLASSIFENKNNDLRIYTENKSIRIRNNSKIVQVMLLDSSAKTHLLLSKINSNEAYIKINQPGIYILKVVTENAVETRKILIQ